MSTRNREKKEREEADKCNHIKRAGFSVAHHHSRRWPRRPRFAAGSKRRSTGGRATMRPRPLAPQLHRLASLPLPLRPSPTGLQQWYLSLPLSLSLSCPLFLPYRAMEMARKLLSRLENPAFWPQTVFSSKKTPPPPNFQSHLHHIKTLNIANDSCMEY